MIIPDELPIIYSTPFLIPEYGLKIKLKIESHSDLFSYLLQSDKKSKLIGIIPEIDFGKEDDVIGTVGLIRSIIKINPENFFILLQGLNRFQLGETVSDGSLKINKITVIENFVKLVGDEKEKNKIQTEFIRVLLDLSIYTDRISPFIIENIKKSLKDFPLYKTVEYCMKNIINLTSADAYKILRAKDLNTLLKFEIDWFERETVEKINQTKCDKTDLIPLPPEFYAKRKKNSLIRSLLPEFKVLYTAIKESNMPAPVYDIIMNDFKKLLDMSCYSSDYSVILNYINYVTNLPWKKSTKETLELEKAKSVLQLNHYGMDTVKKRILQFIAVRILNPERRGPILCFIGPPGVGKTTIAKSIADSLNRTFKRISLGGINNFSDIKGHRKTYVGAMPGCIIQAVNEVKTNNPIILLDEIDKMRKSMNGDPAAALLEVLDPEQNSSFVDSYVNVPFDLSQVMFISTANNIAHIPRTLRDRMEIIDIEGYTIEEKIKIAENYLIPKILHDLKMNEMPITICNNTINSIIKNYTHEAGVRELQRKLEEICYYIAVEIVENSNKELKSYVITPESLTNIFGEKKYGEVNTLVNKCSNRVGVAIGLSWTPVGGQVQVIETSRVPSRNNKSRFVLTGLAGKTLKESVEIAFNWIQSFAMKNDLDTNDFCVHVHLPAGGCKKDGPSAGITIVCALISLLWNIPLREMIAMTGEISLQGFVLPVGGVKNKVLAAYNADIKTVIIPEPNMKEITGLPDKVREGLNIIPVKHLKEVLDIVIPGGLASLQNSTVNVMPKCKL